MSRSTYISNGTREAARRRAQRRWWAMVGVNLLCMLLFTASMLGIGYIFLDHLDQRALSSCETITTEVDDQGMEYSFCDG